MNIIILYSTNFKFKSNKDYCLIKNKKNTILDTQVKCLRKVFKNPNITIFSKQKPKKTNTEINANNINIIENSLCDITNCLYNINLTKLGQSVLIIPNNIIFAESLLKGFDRSKSFIWLMKEYNDIGCSIQNDKVINIMFGLNEYWTGIAYFANKEMDLLKEIISKSYVNKWHLFEGLNWIIENGGEFSVIKKKNKIKTINKNYNV